MARKFAVFLDMDEVLVDFRGGACRVHGITVEELERRWIPGAWHIAGVLGITVEEFWKPINESGEQFWLDLEWMPWRDDLLEFVKSISIEWYIVSDPSIRYCDVASSGKVKYLKKFFGSSFDNFIPTRYKSLVARHPNALLIDDRETNVQEFCSSGGDALVFPTIFNSLNTYADKPVDYLRSILKLFP